MNLSNQEIQEIIQAMENGGDYSNPIIGKLLQMAGLDCELLPTVAVAPVVELAGVKFIMAELGHCQTCQGKGRVANPIWNGKESPCAPGVLAWNDPRNELFNLGETLPCPVCNESGEAIDHNVTGKNIASSISDCYAMELL